MGTVTISGNNYDIYGTSAAADIYLAARLGTDAWTAATATVKAQALVTGTRLIQRWLGSLGYDVDPAGAVDIEIEQANYELAFALVTDPSIADTSQQSGGNKKRVKAGSAEVEYFSPEIGARFPHAVQSTLNLWITAQGGTSAASLIAPSFSGGSSCAVLQDCDFGITRGY